jgi:hypothetical protein
VLNDLGGHVPDLHTALYLTVYFGPDGAQHPTVGGIYIELTAENTDYTLHSDLALTAIAVLDKEPTDSA